MKLTVVSPTEKKELAIAWIEVNTPVGNFVIQSGHAPMMLTLTPNTPLLVRLKTGKQTSLENPGGFLEINRETATLLLHA